MRIEYVGSVPPTVGGIAQHGAQLVRALRSQGHQVGVHSWTAQYPRWLYPGPQRDPRAAPFEDVASAMTWWNPRTWWRAGSAAKDHDLLVFPWVTPVQALAYRTVIAGSRNLRSVVLVHNPLPHERRPGDIWLTRWVLSRVHGAVVHSRTGADVLRRLDLRMPIVHVPMPPLLNITESKLPERPPFKLLFFGMVRPYKGVDIAVEALALLRRRGIDASLTVAGEFWTSVDDLRRTAREAGVEDQVSIRSGYISDGEVSDLFAGHHLVIAPYRSATQSAIVPLAFAAGRPVVATDVGGLREQVVEGVTGTVAPPGDVEALAAAAERAVGALTTLADGARAHKTSWGNVASAVLQAAG